MLPKKIVWDIETFGLESMQDRIISIGVMDIDTEEIKVFLDIEESVMLHKFWEYIIDVTEAVGFNSDSFDWPFIIKRSLINKVRVSNLPSKHTDLRKLCNGFWISYERFGKGTLRDWAQVLGLQCETCPGNEMPALFVKGDFDAIIKHNTEDLILTHKLYKLAEYCNLIRD